MVNHVKPVRVTSETSLLHTSLLKYRQKKHGVVYHNQRDYKHCLTLSQVPDSVACTSTARAVSYKRSLIPLITT